MDHVFARCENHIYAWKTSNGYGKAERVESLSGVSFKSMTSGLFSTFGVLYEGEWYQFEEDVGNPQIIKRDAYQVPIRKALQMNFLSFLLLDNGCVVAWGTNVFRNLGIRSNEDFITTPVFLELVNVKDVKSTIRNTYFLKRNGHIYFCGVYYQFESGIVTVCHQCEPRKLDENRKFQSIECFDQHEHIIARSNDKVFKLVNDKLYETCYSNYKDYLADNFQLTIANLNVNNPNKNSNGELQGTTTISHNNNADRFEIQFSDKTPLGEGAFGLAYKVRDIFDGKYYCIKKIDRHKTASHSRSGNTTILRENFSLVASSMINSTILLKFYGTWEFENFTFFKLELMDSNLSDFVKLSRKIFKRKKFDKMDSVEFQLYCHLFVEILSCIHELHVNRMMHRDLKLENILMNFVSSDNHIKLGDLGSSRLNENVVQRENDEEKNAVQEANLTQGKGTPGYIAPEVKRGTEYSFSADIWSLGVIAKGIFGIRNWETFKLYENNSSLCKRFSIILETIQSMTFDDPAQRPDIKEIANKFWSVIDTDADFKRKLLIEFGEISRIKDDGNFDDLLGVRRIRLESLESSN